MNIEDCLGEGLLAKAVPDAAKAVSSLSVADRKLSVAEKERKHGIWESAVISAYSSMFHAARALLYRDGFKERSHYALYVYVNEKYAGKLERKYLNELNSLRLARHELMYGIEETAGAGEDDAKEAVEAARGFLGAVEKIIKGEKQNGKRNGKNGKQ